jgi:hypothetical protein
MRSAILFFLTPVLAFLLAGCGIDGDLTCGFSSCAPPDAQANDATSAGSADGPGDGRDRSVPADVRVAEAATDSSMLSSTGDGGEPSDAAPLGDGCVMCGLGPCCAPSHQCIASGTTCCGNAAASCGGEQGSCCAGLVCTAARRCGASCVATGSCAQQSDCCLGAYCDTSLQCAACLALNAACTQSYECCTGVCRNSVCGME